MERKPLGLLLQGGHYEYKSNDHFSGYFGFLTALRKKAAELDALYDQLPAHRGVKDTILLDAWSSATIEGARTTVQRVRDHFENPKTKDDRMVVNTIMGSNYAYNHPITENNIRRLWEKIVDGVCENEEHRGKLYRDGMVYIGSGERVIHVPAQAEQLPELMAQWFSYREADNSDLLIRSFVAHFYFVYLPINKAVRSSCYMRYFHSVRLSAIVQECSIHNVEY